MLPFNPPKKFGQNVPGMPSFHRLATFSAIRRFFLLTLAMVGCGQVARAIDAAVIINEIQYNPLSGEAEWIELHSLTGVDIDLSGWKFSQGIDYTFAEGAKITGHGYLVVASNPGSPALTGVGALGPWTGLLDGNGETITLVNRDGREMDTVDYKDSGDWPAGPDGSGATLARRNSEWAQPGPGSWVASAKTNGTPGQVNFGGVGQPAPADETPGPVFNEISPGDAGFQLELTNTSGAVVNLDGYTIRSSAGNTYALTGSIDAGGFVTVDATQLGFTPISGDKLFLFKADGVSLLDARQVTNRLRGRSTQFPGRWLFPSAATFGAANTFSFNTDIVINEIMYRPRPLSQQPFTDDPEQWIELYNRGASPVDLTGWKLAEGISFDFPSGKTIPAGGYLVVSNDAVALMNKWPAVASSITGNFSGTVKRGGELIRIEDANGNPVNEVSFVNDAPWPLAAKGGGSSLELRDPRADNSRPEAWAASDESYRGSWNTYTYEALASQANGSDPTQWNEFIFGLLEAGSFLIDDISVIEAPTGVNRQVIQNGSFASAASWRFLGTHSRASVISDPSGTGSVLRVDATGPTEHMHNHCETTLKASGTEITINGSLTYRISFRARWISGSNQLNSRLYFDRIARRTLLPVAVGGGTPGAANTAFVANQGPTFTGLSHAPSVPNSGQSVTVSATAADPDGLGAVNLFYSVNGGSFSNVAMTSQGQGRFTGTIPAQGTGAKVQFYVRALDSLGVAGFAPAGGTSSRAMVQWNDGQARLTLNGVAPNNIRIVMTPADVTKLHTATNAMSNDLMPCTVIWNERDVYYDCGLHLHGSERGRNTPVRISYNLHFPGDRLLLGVQDSVVIDRSGTGDQNSQKEILIKRAITHAGGLPGSEDDLIRVLAPQTAQTGPAILGRQRIVSGEYLESAYQDGDEGDLFKYELIYYPTSTVDGNRESLKLPNPDQVAGVGVQGLGTDKEIYRWHWLIANKEDQDDYSGLITFLTAFGRGADAQYYLDTNAMMDVNEWMRAFAMESLFGIGDNYASGAQHNLYIYRRPSDFRWVMFPYDMDFTFNLGTTSGMMQNGDLSKLTQLGTTPGYANNRAFWAHVYDICQTSFSTTYLTPWAQHYTKFVDEDLTQFMTYVNDRRNYALSQVSSNVPNPAAGVFDITTANTSTASATFNIQGVARVDVAEMRLAGSAVPLNVSWLSTTIWRVALPIAPGPNVFTINAFNRQGVQIGTDSVTITGTGATVPASAANLVISEIMYHPPNPSAAEVTAGYTDSEVFEYLELQNISANTINLANCQFTAGVQLVLSPTTTTMAPGARVMVVGNQTAFLQRYGGGRVIVGQYQPATFLKNSGDHITLLDAQGQVIRNFSYDDEPAWPVSPDGDGYSLVLVNPASNPDHADPLNWRASTAIKGNPGVSDATTFSGVPLDDDDGNGIVNLVQYAMAATSASELPVSGSDGSYLTITFQRNLAADDARFVVERSTDLSAWSSAPADVAYVSENNNGNGTATYVWRSAHLRSESVNEFLRVRVLFGN